jgi:chromosome segregation ATPase
LTGELGSFARPVSQLRLMNHQSVEKKETSLKKMLATVLKDKEKIEATIEELDRYKRDALQKTWEKVNQ